MITEEFEGDTKMFSSFEHGAIFQSSFLLKLQAESQEQVVPFKKGRKKSITTIEYRNILRAAKVAQMEKCLANFKALSASRDSFEFN